MFRRMRERRWCDATAVAVVTILPLLDHQA
jgi:hypothetical protein